MTVRKASELLISEGLLERRPGKGLYVRGLSAVLGGSVVQVVVGSLLWETSVQMARGVQNAAKADGIHVQIYDAHGDVDSDLAMIEQLPYSGAKGAVVMSLHHPRFSQAICRLHTKDFPFVLLDQRMRDIDVSSVAADNYAGGRQIGEYLARLGHRHVAYIGDLIAASVQDRLAGLRDGLADAGVAMRPSYIHDLTVDSDRFGDWSEAISSGARRLLTLPVRPTAICCSCDAVARQVYRDLKTLNLRVPDDVSVVGYDDDPLADYLVPRLSTVRQPFQNMGMEAMQLLRRRIADPSATPEHVTLSVEFVERESVAPPRS